MAYAIAMPTPNQIVAFNLRRAREERGWTQDEVAEHLEPHLGTRWSKANVSAAERSVGGKRIKHFSADELVAFSRTFEVPVEWFLALPPFVEELLKGGVADLQRAGDFCFNSPPEVMQALFQAPAKRRAEIVTALIAAIRASAHTTKAREDQP